MVKYEVNFREEPMLYFGLEVNKGEVSVYCDTEKEEDFERFMCTVRVK